MIIAYVMIQYRQIQFAELGDNEMKLQLDSLVNGLGTDCEALRDFSPVFEEGVHDINIDGKKVPTFCTKDGYTVFQSRGQFGNAQDYFKRNWTEYETGFGEPGKVINLSPYLRTKSD